MSSRFSTFRDAEQYLEQIPMFSVVGRSAARMDLSPMKAFCEVMGHPERRLPFIHVAGTNGKGTVCQMVSSVAIEAGIRTGTYLSPHLLRVNERVQIDGKEILNSDILLFFQTFEKELDRISLTYFELWTCIALWAFDRANTELAVMETGLGGRLDATNVIDPLATAITSVAMDHMDFLGDSLEQIAAEKAGIVKPGVPLVIGDLDLAAKDVVIKVAENRGSDWQSASDYIVEQTDESVRLNYNMAEISVDMKERKEVDAIHMAITSSLFSILRKRYPIPADTLVRGLERSMERFPEHAHFQKLHSRLNWYFDGAHNPEAAESLATQIKKMIPKYGEPSIFFTLMKDKVVPEWFDPFEENWAMCFVKLPLQRCAGVGQLKTLNRNLEFREIPMDDERLLEKLRASKTKLVIFTGSVYFYSQVKRWMAGLFPNNS
ncbi:MAG: Mur ligase family protein [Balneolaceae bacterium]